ncbi:hypothetical protein HMPREF0322_01120 [Desulfitobacterium hafniense DP7]|uniref:Uncharacterized protein n=1 Tax=Desulfitobacterium hafniense DP7 TaxID=537010 RepID=G9XJI9_DESHA|nr:hypothetical protein HMPREF0322_01120 [Desulfitobacterium hafniense DP7]
MDSRPFRQFPSYLILEKAAPNKKPYSPSLSSLNKVFLCFI